ncbi:phosphoglycerate mutase family protein [Streptococcus massiliensis]|uniref:Phosphoglycerate mutase family protein n=1 Tax=Streptococcus massiliensis TaxID=313439 RepID=A0A380L4I4_9STRE|nr:phosphoglycerate mutase family protein [Streptococcus massiliensis]
MTTLYLMRHGQTFFNQQGLVQGSSDSPLTEPGIEQAQKAQAFFQKKVFPLIASMLPRRSGLAIRWKSSRVARIISA